MNEMFSQGGKGSTGILTNKQAIARKFGVKQNEVIYFEPGAVISGYKVIYDKSMQRAYFLPSGIAVGTTAISLSNSGVLVHSAGSVDLAALAVTRKEYVTLPDTFTSGSIIQTKNELLTHNGTQYRWAGGLPKSVPPNSTPVSAGGISSTAWIIANDELIRQELNNGLIPPVDSTSVYDVPGIVVNTTTDNRAAAYAFPGKIFIPKGVTIRCNLLPDDDVRKFVGEGTLIVKNQWYNSDLTFDVGAANNGNGKSVKDTLLGAVYTQESPMSIGIVGDSITDGAWGKQNWSSPPLDGNGNLQAPIAYNHGQAGGSHSWCAHWQWLMNMVQSRWTDAPIFQVYNASLSGAKLSDGWGYRNFDQGFFGNSSYGAKAPKVCILAMGWNDANQNLDSYRDQIDKFVRKAWGYGCAVGIVTVNENDPKRIGFESATKRQMCTKLGIDYFDLGKDLTEQSNVYMKDMEFFYAKKEGTWDTTHPQELGQMVMGDSMFMQTLGEKYVRRVKAGDMMLPSVVESFWDAVTWPSSNHLLPQYGKTSGSPVLNALKYLPMAQSAGENVSFNTFVWCDEDDISLTVYEPWTGDAIVGVNNHLNVLSPAGLWLDESDPTYGTRNATINTRRTYLTGKLASFYFGPNKSLTTYGGRLRKGLNNIVIVNGGQLPTCWYPALKFGHSGTDGITLPPVRLSRGPETKPNLIIQDGTQFDDYMINNTMTGRKGAMTADSYIRQSTLVGCIKVPKGLAINQYIALNCNPLKNTAVLIGVASDGRLVAGSWNGTEVGDWNFFTSSGTSYAGKGFTIWHYTQISNGAHQFNVVTDDGVVNGTNVYTTTLITSGGIGTYAKTHGLIEVSAHYSLTNVG